MALLLRSFARASPVIRQSTCILPRRSAGTAPPSAYEEMQKFWQKNAQLKRPLSPHLSIYRYNLTMMLSISNRITGVGLQAVMTLGGIGVLAGSLSYSDALQKIKSWKIGPALIGIAKLGLSLIFAYHTVASVRHLVWDAGIGYSKPMTLQGSYAVLAATAVLTLILLFYKPPMPVA